MLKYRRDIDGLRALAVSLVVLYHYNFSFFSGGFVGVDVFFVISGYLITQLLVDSQAKGQFRFSDFYARRIRRLLPAFLFVSFCTFLVISRYYMDDDFYLFSKSWMGAVIGLSNFFFYDELAQYFTSDAQVISLLHTWSLAVEEQFYVIWPAALLLMGAAIRRPVFIFFFAVIWLLSFVFSIWLAEINAVAAYFLLPARMFELLLGCGLALFSDRLPVLGRWLRECLSLVGFLLIIGSAALLSKASHFPGYNALWPTLGAVLIIYAGQEKPTSRVNIALSYPPVVYLGTLSYALYLWHWPPVALLNYQLVELTLDVQMALIGFSLIAAWFTHRYVENIFRYRHWNLKKTFCWLIFLPCLLIWILQVVIRTYDDLSLRIPEDKRELYKIVQQSDAGDIFERCFDADDYYFEQGDTCLFGRPSKDGKPNSVLIGDSHATSMIGFLEALVDDTEYYFLAVTKASAPFIAEPHTRKALGREKNIVRSQALQKYLSSRPMTVFIASWWTSYFNNPEYSRYVLDTIDWLIQQGHRVVMLEDAPILPSDSYAFCLIRGSGACDINRAEVDQMFSSLGTFQRVVLERFPSVQWIDLKDVLCDKTRCRSVIDGVPLYRDYHHLNYLGSKKLAETYIQSLGHPLKHD